MAYNFEEVGTVIRKCKLCRGRPAAVPDREAGGRPVRAICRECHAKRLAGDLRTILARDKGGKVDDGP